MPAARSIQTRPPSAVRNARGYTLIELLIALVVAAVMLTVSIPAFREYSATQRAVALANTLLTDVNLARSEALRRSGGARLVPAGARWTDGWQVEYVDGGEPIAAHAVAGPAALSVEGDPAAILFDAFGALVAPASGVELEICVPVGGMSRIGRRVVISPSGHAEVRKPASAGPDCA